MNPSMGEQLAAYGKERPLYDPIYDEVTSELIALRNDYQEIVEHKTDWEARGPMWQVVDHRVTELVTPTIRSWVSLTQVTAKLIWHRQKWQVGVTGISQEHGEVWPHGDGRFRAIRK